MIHFNRSNGHIHYSITAYIAFLLFFFFLMFSSMNTEKGGPIRPVSDNMDISAIRNEKPRNIFNIYLTGNNEIQIGNDVIEIDELCDLVKEFVDNPSDNESEPEKTESYIHYFGPMLITAHHVILLHYNRDATYDSYLAVHNEIERAYYELRNDLSKRKWQKKYANLPFDEQRAILKIYPTRIVESIYK
jgi:hypothetical protein